VCEPPRKGAVPDEGRRVGSAPISCLPTHHRTHMAHPIHPPTQPPQLTHTTPSADPHTTLFLFPLPLPPPLRRFSRQSTTITFAFVDASPQPPGTASNVSVWETLVTGISEDAWYRARNASQRSQQSVGAGRRLLWGGLTVALGGRSWGDGLGGGARRALLSQGPAAAPVTLGSGAVGQWSTCSSPCTYAVRGWVSDGLSHPQHFNPVTPCAAALGCIPLPPPRVDSECVLVRVFVRAQGLAAGYYTLEVKATDAAGNLGGPSDALHFQVGDGCVGLCRGVVCQSPAHRQPAVLLRLNLPATVAACPALPLLLPALPCHCCCLPCPATVAALPLLRPALPCPPPNPDAPCTAGGPLAGPLLRPALLGFLGHHRWRGCCSCRAGEWVVRFMHALPLMGGDTWAVWLLLSQHVRSSP
jgi:hypothetical protein